MKLCITIVVHGQQEEVPMASEEIKVNNTLCNGCGICINTCPMDVMRMDEKNQKAVAKYPEDCMICLLCEEDCPQEAIYVSPVKNSPLLLAWG